MKKIRKPIIFVLSLFVLCPIFLSGCNTNFVLKFSKDVDEYAIELFIDEVNHKVSASQTTSYINKTDTTLNNVCFHLYANSFSKGVANKPVSPLYEAKAYPNGESFGGIQITLLKVNGNVTEQTLEGIDKTILNVKLLNELFPNERVDIYFEYEITLPNINHRFGYGNNTINLGNFYPIACVYENGGFNKSEYHHNGDPFYSNISNYKVTVTNNENYTIASTGHIINNSVNNHEKTTVLEAKAVRDFAIVVSNKFNTLSQKVGDTNINYYYYNDANPEQSLQTSVDALNTFNQLIGKYPYSNLAVVEANFVHGGMEFPNLVMISDCLEKYQDYQNTIVHEIAHQWWYGVVGNNEYNYGWLDEGLTEYTTALFYEHNASYGLTYNEIMQNANSSYCLFVEVYEDIFGEVDTTMNRKLDEFNTEPEYVYISYVKGMLLFDSIREIIGEKTFLRCLKNYYRTYQGKNVSPDRLIKSFETTSLRSLESIFNSWIDGSVVVAPKEIKNGTQSDL